MGAEVRDGDTGRVARWRDDKGKWRQAQLNKSGDRIVLLPRKDDPYWVAYDDENGQRRTVKANRDKEVSEAMARRLEIEAGMRREGLVNPFVEHGKRPIREASPSGSRVLDASGRRRWKCTS